MARYDVNYGVVRDVDGCRRARGASPATPRRSSSTRRAGDPAARRTGRSRRDRAERRDPGSARGHEACARVRSDRRAGSSSSPGCSCGSSTHQHTTVAARPSPHGKVVQAPAFTLTRLGGGPLADARLAPRQGGRRQLLGVVLRRRASRRCRASSAAAHALGRQGSVAVVGIDDARQPPGRRRTFARAHGVTYPIGFDHVGDDRPRYGVAYTPTTFFVDRRGRIVKRVLGPVLERGARRADRARAHVVRVARARRCRARPRRAGVRGRAARTPLRSRRSSCARSATRRSTSRPRRSRRR